MTFTLIDNSEDYDLSFNAFCQRCREINRFYNPANPKLAVSTPEKVGYEQGLQGRPVHEGLLAGYLGLNCRPELAYQALAIYQVGYQKGREARRSQQPHLTVC
ncbi:MAG: hypothetical protein MJ157_01220 [Clostridia bacterium]|nr:hypothetical protein [Clostridia bacterium]